QQTAERSLAFDPYSIHSEILIAPHHGSSESTTVAFVRAVDPQFIISSNDSTLTTKQRRFEHRVDSRRLYRTHHTGAFTITINPDGRIDLSTFLKDAQGSAPPDRGPVPTPALCFVE